MQALWLPEETLEVRAQIGKQFDLMRGIGAADGRASTSDYGRP